MFYKFKIMKTIFGEKVISSHSISYKMSVLVLKQKNTKFILIIAKTMGFKEIRQWSINWFTPPMIIHRISPSVDYNYWLKCLDTQFNEATHENSIKVPKVFKQTNKKTSWYNLGDWCNIQPNVPSLHCKNLII